MIRERRVFTNNSIIHHEVVLHLLRSFDTLEIIQMAIDTFGIHKSFSNMSGILIYRDSFSLL